MSHVGPAIPLSSFMKNLLPAVLATAVLAACQADGGSTPGTADTLGAGQPESPPAADALGAGQPASPPAADAASPADPGATPGEPPSSASDLSASEEPGVDRDGTGVANPADAGDRAETPTPAAPASPRSAANTAPEPEFFHFSRPEKVRGLYLNAWSAGSRRRLAALTALAERTEINSFVIDIKDATGYVSHRTRVPLAHEIGATGEIRIPSLPHLLGTMQEAGIYPIARIVIVKDPLLIAARPDLAVQDTAGGVWIDGKGIVWLNPHQRELWDYHVDLAREVAEWGFPEIQWDYVRFPDAPASELGRAHFPGADGRTRTDAIRDFLAYSRDELADTGVRVTADVFGVTTSATHDVGIGQVWESFIDVVDVALPMVYPSHYWRGSFGYDSPNAHPYEIVRSALEHSQRRSAEIPGAGATRPWLQDFTLGRPPYGAAEVRAQIQATYDVGIDEWILWNPGSRYTEEALEPVGGFAEEPMMRIAEELVPVSRRYELYDTATVTVGKEDSIPARPAGAKGGPSPRR